MDSRAILLAASLFGAQTAFASAHICHAYDSAAQADELVNAVVHDRVPPAGMSEAGWAEYKHALIKFRDQTIADARPSVVDEAAGAKSIVIGPGMSGVVAKLQFGAYSDGSGYWLRSLEISAPMETEPSPSQVQRAPNRDELWELQGREFRARTDDALKLAIVDVRAMMKWDAQKDDAKYAFTDRAAPTPPGRPRQLTRELVINDVDRDLFAAARLELFKKTFDALRRP